MDFSKVAEKRIEAAIDAGELDNLPGNGKPLPREEMTSDPMERAGFKMMARAGALPPEILIRKEIAKQWEAFRAARTQEERMVIQKRLAELEMRFAMMMEGRR